MAASIVALVDDLFLAKIRETAKSVEFSVATADAKRGSAGISEIQPQAVVLDLNS